MATTGGAERDSAHGRGSHGDEEGPVGWGNSPSGVSPDRAQDCKVRAVLTSNYEVEHCLVTYTDWWQPTTGSLLQVKAARRASGTSDGMRPGLLETLEERAELGRRVWQLRETDRHLLLLWYVQQLDTEDIAQILGISRRQCFRRRTRAIRKIVELGEPEQAA